MSKRIDRLLQRSHREFGIHYSEYLANHLVHHLLTLKGLGADEIRLQNCFDTYSRNLEPRRPTSITISRENWRAHLGNAELYDSYVEYFDQELQGNDTKEKVLQYLPTILPSLIGDALHPLIHLGFGLEFYQPVVVSEALAFGCMNNSEYYDSFVYSYRNLPNVAIARSSAMDIIQELHQEPLLDEVIRTVKRVGPFKNRMITVISAGEGLFTDKLNRWLSNGQMDLLKDLEDLYLLACRMYLSTLEHPNPYLDFFILHTITGMHASRIIAEFLKDEPNLQFLLLRASFFALMTVYCTQKRPKIMDNWEKYAKLQKNLSWDEIIDLAKSTDEEHVPKVVRGAREASKIWPQHELLFKVVAGQTAQRIRTGEEFEFDGK